MKSQNKNLNWNWLITLFLIVCYFFYRSICFGYFFSKIFYDFVDSLNKTSFSETIKLRKKFNLKQIFKIIFDFFWTLFCNWLKRGWEKVTLLCDACKLTLTGIIAFLKFKWTFRRLQDLLGLLLDNFEAYWAMRYEFSYFLKLIKWVIEWKNIIRLLMEEFLFLTRIVYGLYLILFMIFGVFLGFLLGILSRYKDDNEIYASLLLFLLRSLYNFSKILYLYNTGFEFDEILQNLDLRSSEAGNIDEISFKVFELKNSSPGKLGVPKLPEKPQIPFPLLGDPFLSIDVEVLFQESVNYEFELFRFYFNANQNLKS